MFDDQQQQQVDNGAAMPMMDQGQMSQQPQVADAHQMTPAYPTDDMSQPQAPAPVASAADDDLLAIKQDALNSLSPLVAHLDQTPEEKFRTTMMLIQASDDRSLVRVAYEAAQAIVDEKSRAQALLDVINEINYFTSHSS